VHSTCNGEPILYSDRINRRQVIQNLFDIDTTYSTGSGGRIWNTTTSTTTVTASSSTLPTTTIQYNIDEINQELLTFDRNGKCSVV